LINQTFDQKEILLNNIFLKQIWNAVRLCIQKGFLPENIKECLSKFPKDFEDFDICLLEKIKELNEEWLDIKTYEQYTKFFNSFKESIQNTFFSWYLEILKVHPTKNVQFVCSYFFNFILTILYPSIPEFVDALQYVSQRDFMFKVDTIKLDKTTDYNMNILYTTFIKIKQLKIESNIKQHETCNVFIKSTPTI
jgi:valyl-tRNA synthetase